MTGAQIFALPDRGVIAVNGPDASTWLDNLVTNDLTSLDKRPLLFTALLSPQGKILFEFFVYKNREHLLLETSRSVIDDLVKRLKLFKLRAKVELTDVTHYWTTIWGTGSLSAPTTALSSGAILGGDPRSSEGLWRGLCPTAKLQSAFGQGDYLAERVRRGIPEAPHDYALGDTFPHEANYDLQDGVSFTKGCFVGQEVVSRMQNKTVVRKRVVRVTSTAPLTSGIAITTGAATIGTIGSTDGQNALALLRLDRVVEAIDQCEPVRAGNHDIAIDPMALQRYRQSIGNRSASEL